MNSLLGRSGDTNSNPTSNRFNNTNNSDIHIQAEQARIQAEFALKGLEENNNRQREVNAKGQADSRARAQAEAQRKEAEDLLRRNLTGDLIHPGDDYFQLSRSNVISFVDSSFSDIGENRKSTAGLIQYLGYSPIYWETFVANTTIPISTAEAEYVAPHVAGKEIVATNNLLTEFQLPQTRVPLYEDN